MIISEVIGTTVGKLATPAPAQSQVKTPPTAPAQPTPKAPKPAAPTPATPTPATPTPAAPGAKPKLAAPGAKPGPGGKPAATPTATSGEAPTPAPAAGPVAFDGDGTPAQMGVKNLSGKTIPGGMQKNKQYAIAGDNYIDASREANPNAPKGTRDPWTRYNSKDVEQTSVGSGEKTMVPGSPDNQTQMDVAKLELDDPDLVKRGLNKVPLEVDQNGMGLTFGTQADLTAKNRQNRRQAYKDHLAGNVSGVDWSQYSPEEMKQVEADAKMDTKAFGNSILDQMEKTTGFDMSKDREDVNRGEGGVGWTSPAAEHGRRQGEAAEKKRIEKYRNASTEVKARMRKFDPYNKKYDEIEQEQGITVPNPEKDRKQELQKRFRASMAAGDTDNDFDAAG